MSKTIRTKHNTTPYLSNFVACFVEFLWHNTPLETSVARISANQSAFAIFTHDILLATNLSFSVVILALKYIHKLKSRHPTLKGAGGSECRILVCALILAMKFLMDNSYTNLTWHQVSNIPHSEINKAENEFLMQIKFDLNVNEKEYYSWFTYIENEMRKFRFLQQNQEQQMHIIRSCSPSPLPSTTQPVTSSIPMRSFTPPIRSYSPQPPPYQQQHASASGGIQQYSPPPYYPITFLTTAVVNPYVTPISNPYYCTYALKYSSQPQSSLSTSTHQQYLHPNNGGGGFVVPQPIRASPWIQPPGFVHHAGLHQGYYPPQHHHHQGQADHLLR